MIQACCHFLYPIVLNPWCMSLLHVHRSHADLQCCSSSSRIIYHIQTQTRYLYYASCINSPFHSRQQQTATLAGLVHSVAKLQLHSVLSSTYLYSQWQRRHHKDHQVMHIPIHIHLSQDNPVYALRRA